MSEFKPITVEEVEEAQGFLSTLLPPTPCLLNPWLSEYFGCEIFLKLETMQPIGSFKIRGATYKISRLSEEEKKRGVLASSAGNHAQGVAWGSKRLGVDALIVMPLSAALMKIENTRGLGAKVELQGENYDEAYAHARQILKESGRVFLHPYQDRDVIAGQGGVALELLAQVPAPDFILGAIGGGGLMAGVGAVIKARSPKTKLIGCQALGAPSMAESFKMGRAVQLPGVHTFADGIAVKNASEEMLFYLQKNLERVETASEGAIALSVLKLLEKAKVLAEGSGAIPLAVLEGMRKEIRGKRVVLLISGGNIDVNLLDRIIDVGLIRSGRRLRVNVVLSDRPGSLRALTQILSEQGANILQTLHDRSEPSTSLDEVDVSLLLETRGDAHAQSIVDALRGHCRKVDVLNSASVTE